MTVVKGKDRAARAPRPCAGSDRRWSAARWRDGPEDDGRSSSYPRVGYRTSV